METPKISIIVPIYNAEKYLIPCLNSILKQTYSNFELLLIDDGSTDKSRLICDNYAQLDNRIKIFHKKNTGVSATRNLGIKNTIGDWVCFVDSDDTLESNYLQVFVNLLSKYEADCYITSCKIISKEKVSSKVLEESFFNKTNIYKSIIKLREKTLLGVPWNKMFRVNIIKKYNIYFDESISSYEDEIFVLQYFKYSKAIYTSPIQTYNYYYSNNMESLSKKYIEISTHFKIMDIIYELGLQFSQNKKFIEHLNYNYTSHLADSIGNLYGIHLLYKKGQRLTIIKLIKDRAQRKGFYNLLTKVLKKRHLYNLNHLSFLDLNGQLLHLYRRAKHSLS